MICGHSPDKPWRDKPRECSRLCVHEIANGPHRAKALDKPYATLVLCWYCNGFEVEDKVMWPEARQLALLLHRDRASYDLGKYLELTSPDAPNRITPQEVAEYLMASF